MVIRRDNGEPSVVVENPDVAGVVDHTKTARRGDADAEHLVAFGYVVSAHRDGQRGGAVEDVLRHGRLSVRHRGVVAGRDGGVVDGVPGDWNWIAGVVGRDRG